MYNGSSETFVMLAEHSGVNPMWVQPRTNVVLVTFYTDGSVVSSGFIATFNALTAPVSTTQPPGMNKQTN